jgi:hypothetical protein
MSCRTKCSYHVFVKIGKLIETFKRSYTQARAHGDDDHKILLIYIFSFYFCFFKREGWFKAQSLPHSKCPPYHEHQLVYSVFHMLRMLYLVAHGVRTCAEQQMTLHNLYSVQGWNKKEFSFGCSFCHVWSKSDDEISSLWNHVVTWQAETWSNVISALSRNSPQHGFLIRANGITGGVVCLHVYDCFC